MSISRSSWRTVAIADLAAQASNALVIGPFGSDLKVSDYTETGIPIVFVRNVHAGLFDDRGLKFVSLRKAIQLKAHTVRAGDLLATKMGNPPCVATIYPERPDAIVTADLIKMTVNRSAADERYLMHFLNSDAARSQVARFTFGVTRPKVTLKDFKSLKVPLPSLREQKRIAAILDAAESLREKRRQATELIAAVGTAFFASFFGDPAQNPRCWPEVTLGQLAVKFSDGPFGSNLKSAHYVDSGVRVIRLQNILANAFSDDDKAFISERHFNSLRKHECLPGDLLIGTMGDPNLRTCIQPDHVHVALNKADCVQMRVDEASATREYICALLNHPSIERKAQDKIQGQTRLRISMGRLRDLLVPTPPLELQQRFAEIVRRIEQVRSPMMKAMEAEDVLIQSLRHRAFRGEL